MQTLHLRRIKTTLRISVPYQFVRKRGLSEGDQCIWIEEGDSVRLRFVKFADVAAAAGVPQETEQATAA
jgi:hypothetical protein